MEKGKQFYTPVQRYQSPSLLFLDPPLFTELPHVGLNFLHCRPHYPLLNMNIYREKQNVEKRFTGNNKM